MSTSMKHFEGSGTLNSERAIRKLQSPLNSVSSGRDCRLGQLVTHTHSLTFKCWWTALFTLTPQ